MTLSLSIKSEMENLKKAYEPIVNKLYPNQQNTGTQPTKEQMDEFMKQHPEMFGNGGPFNFSNNGATQNDGPVDVDATVVD